MLPVVRGWVRTWGGFLHKHKYMMWYASPAHQALASVSAFQLFREVRIMKLLNHPNIGKSRSAWISGFLFLAEPSESLAPPRPLTPPRVFFQVVYHENNNYSNEACSQTGLAAVPYSLEGFCCFIFLSSLPTSEIIWSDRNGEDPLPGYGVCQRRSELYLISSSKSTTSSLPSSCGETHHTKHSVHQQRWTNPFLF